MNDQRELDSSIASRLWRSWGAFFSRYGRLTEVQRQAIPLIIEGHDVLVCSATASGKTEAVCAPLLERYLSSRNPWRILYISPTRALVNDLYERLSTPLFQLDCKMVRRTGDHRDKIIPETKLIITTPESFDSLLCRKKLDSGHVLANIVAVVMDEIHLLYGSARGEQLRWLLKRLQRLRTYAHEKRWTSDCSMQMIGLSATLTDPHAVSRQFLSASSKVIVIPGFRSIESVSVPSENPSTEKSLPIYMAQLRRSEKILVFCNKRQRVDSLARELRKILKPLRYKVYAHHGSLDKRLREAAEGALKNNTRVVLVASSTLEIGIDIGDINLVVLDGPAPDVSALLQRIGRGNRLTNKTRVMACSGDLMEVIVHSAMLESASRGDLGIAVNGSQYGVIIQQLASYIFQSPCKYRGRQRIIDLLHECNPEIDGEKFVDHLLKWEIFRQDCKGIWLGYMWSERADRGSIHSNIEAQPGITVIEEGTGNTMATGVSYQCGEILSIAGNFMRFRRWRDRKLEVRKVCDTAGFDAQWGYVSKGWANRDNQPYCVRTYLNIAENVWPMVWSDSGTYVFHLGGSRKNIILSLILQFSIDVPGKYELNNWFLYFPHNKLTSRPKFFRDFSSEEIEILISQNTDDIERKLCRPKSNKELPPNLRLLEISSWLNLFNEIEQIKLAIWQKEKNLDLKNILTALIDPKRWDKT